MSDLLKGPLKELENLSALEAFGAFVESVRATYDVDHVYYYALSLGLEAQFRATPRLDRLPAVDGALATAGRSLAAMSYSKDWVIHYKEAGFKSLDPVLAAVFSQSAPIDWSGLDWSSSRRRSFRDEAVEFGIGNQGFTIPVRGPFGQLAIFTVNKACTYILWSKLLQEYKADFIILAHFTHQRVLELAGLDPAAGETPSLSARERDSLGLMASGLSRGQAAEKLRISDKTIRVYLDLARRKLRAKNLSHAIALASYRGIILPE